MESDFHRFYGIDLQKALFEDRVSWRWFTVRLWALPEQAAWRQAVDYREHERRVSDPAWQERYVEGILG